MLNYQNQTSLTHSKSSLLKQLEQVRDLTLQQLNYQMAVNQMFFESHVPTQGSTEIASNHVFNNQIQSSKSQQQQRDDYQNFQQDSEVSFCQNSDLNERPKGKYRISHNSSVRNDTKNIPKNYGKAILSFIQKSPKTKNFINESNLGITFSDFMMQVRRIKKKVNSIESLRKMWGSEDLDHKIKKCIRILSYKFMRKHCLQYIFHSKVKNYGVHIKYRQKLIEGIQNPVAFNHMKDF